MIKTSVVRVLSLLLLLPLWGCSDNESIPKLVDLKSFDSGAEEEVLGSAVNYTTPKLDILFVIDESGSMRRYQETLAQNIDMFLEGIYRIERLSYRIAVTTSGSTGTSVSYHPMGTVVSGVTPLGTFFKRDPSEPDYITNTTRDGMLLLKDRLMPGDTGHATEKFFEPLVSALTMPGQEDFLRQDAYFAIFFLTDAEDVSNYLDVQGLYDKVLALKGGNPEKLLAYGAVVPSELEFLPSGCTRDDQGPPVNIEAFIRMTGGKIFDICGDDYGKELARVGQELGDAVGTSTVLKEVPAPDTIKVFAGGQEIPNDPRVGWMYRPETNEISFGVDIQIADGDSVRVTYTRANNFHQ